MQERRRSFFMVIRMSRSGVDCRWNSDEESRRPYNERVTVG
jgi:hypothetical protein